MRHSDYTGAWLEIMREDSRAIFRAASQASKAADYLLGILQDEVLIRAAATPECEVA